MKKKILICLTVVLCLTTSVFANKSDVTIFLDGKILEVPTDPSIEDGTTLVPMRSIFEALGMDIYWNQETKTATGKTDEVTIDIIIGNSKAYVNKIEVELPVPAKIINGSTMIPLRFVSEAVGCEVNWDGANKKITIETVKYNKNATNKDGILMESTDKTANLDDLYAVDATGKYEGYKILKGYPGEDKFQIYFKGNLDSHMITYEELEGKNLNEIITWEYQNNLYKNTRRDLYNFFSDTSQFSSSLGISNEVLSYNWFMKTFGNTYTDWMQKIAYSNDASKLVGKYLEKESGFQFENRYEILNSIDNTSEEFERLEREEKERQKQEEKEAMDRIKRLQNSIN